MLREKCEMPETLYPALNCSVNIQADESFKQTKKHQDRGPQTSELI
jgi:hypothetical protein